MSLRVFGAHWLKHSVASQMRRSAPFWDGRTDIPLSAFAQHLTTPEIGSQLCLTRDSGHHMGGWWKNPDYERCWHLSICFRDAQTGVFIPFEKRIAGEWVEAFFGDYCRLIWAEPPFSLDGKRNGIWHYRLFCGPNWEPILPRGDRSSRVGSAA